MSAAAGSRTTAGQRPRSILIIGWLFIAVGTAGLVSTAISYVRDAAGDTAADPARLDVLYASMSQAAALAGGAFLLSGRNWARWLLVAWMAFHVVLSAMHSVSQLLVHCAIFVPITYFLFHRRASAFLTGGRHDERVARR